MITISHFFMLFLICNATHALHAMNDQTDHWNEQYEKSKDLTRQKKERQKKHQNPHSKKKHTQAANKELKKATK